MNVSVRLFAILRERAGNDRVEIDLPETATVADALAALSALPGLATVSGGSARMAVNREYVTPDAPIQAGDELALIPPVSGGAAEGRYVRATGTVHAGVTSERLDLEPLMHFVTDAHAGAVVSFSGLPRDIPVLDYEAYPEMALERVHAILEDCRVRFRLCAIAAEHRIGPVRALEASILIAASAAHRGEAFDGARAALDRIKAEAPIWKVEVGDDGARTRVEGVLPK